MDSRATSVFELIACERLKSGLRDAFTYLLDSLYQMTTHSDGEWPRRDEFVLLIDLIVEGAHLKAYNAAYAEKLFGLTRAKGQSDGTDPQAGPSIVMSLAELTLLPYLKRKMSRYFEELNYKQVRTADDLQQIRLYKMMSNVFSLCEFIALIRYAARRSNYHTTMSAVLGIRLMTRPAIDLLQQNTAANMDKQPATIDVMSRTTADALAKVLSIGSYVIQFLDYWNTHSNSAPLFNGNLPIPEAPNRSDLEFADDKSSSVCLICSHVRQNECVLSNTGYVFCYSCIHRYVTRERKCPVTGQPSTVENVVRLHS